MRSWFLRILKAQSTASTGDTGPSGDHSLMVCSIPLVARTGSVGWHCRHQFHVASSDAHLGSSLSVMAAMTVQGTKLYMIHSVSLPDFLNQHNCNRSMPYQIANLDSHIKRSAGTMLAGVVASSEPGGQLTRTASAEAGRPVQQTWKRDAPKLTKKHCAVTSPGRSWQRLHQHAGC